MQVLTDSTVLFVNAMFSRAIARFKSFSTFFICFIFITVLGTNSLKSVVVTLSNEQAQSIERCRLHSLVFHA